MKSIIVLFFAMISLNAMAFIGNVGHSTALDYAKNPISETIEKQFINVKANGAIGAGKFAAWDLSADDGATVVVAPVSGLAPACVMVNDCADAALCKCQTYGINDSVLFEANSGSATAGKRAWISASSAGYAAARSPEVATEIPVGYFMDASAATGSVQIFIKL